MAVVTSLALCFSVVGCTASEEESVWTELQKAKSSALQRLESSKNICLQSIEKYNQAGKEEYAENKKLFSGKRKTTERITD